MMRMCAKAMLMCVLEIAKHTFGDGWYSVHEVWTMILTKSCCIWVAMPLADCALVALLV